MRTAALQATDELWRRFVSPNGFVLDYAGSHGEVDYPTTEDYQERKPNGLAWFAPTENGAFFTGIVLAGLVQQWERYRDPVTAERARVLAQGLLTLGAAGERSGFVARSVSADGMGHPVAGSDDQTTPWFYGLWRYLKSDLPTEGDRATITAAIIEHALALRATGWSLPCDGGPAFGYRNGLAHFSFIHAARLLFVHRILAEVDSERRDEWLTLYEERLHERDENRGPSRLELLESGMRYGPVGSWTGYPLNPPFWISASAQAGLREIIDLETNPQIKARLSHGLRMNAVGALDHIALANWFDNDPAATFRTEWRFLLEEWQPQSTIEESLAVAERQRLLWARANPRKHHEDKYVREPLFAAWVASLCTDPDVRELARDATARAAAHYDWSTMHMSTFFPVILCEV